MNSSFLYYAWGLYHHKCLREEYEGNTIILHIESKRGQKCDSSNVWSDARSQVPSARVSCLGFHSDLQFPQRIKVFEYAKEHNDEVFPPSQTLHIVLAAQGFLAYLLYFCHAGQFYDLIIDRLSGKICTFAHVASVFFFAISKV